MKCRDSGLIAGAWVVGMLVWVLATTVFAETVLELRLIVARDLVVTNDGPNSASNMVPNAIVARGPCTGLVTLASTGWATQVVWEGLQCPLVELSWDGETNRVYVPEYADSVTGPWSNWSLAFRGQTNGCTYFDCAGGTGRFYRVRVLQ